MEQFKLNKLPINVYLRIMALNMEYAICYGCKCALVDDYTNVVFVKQVKPGFGHVTKLYGEWPTYLRCDIEEGRYMDVVRLATCIYDETSKKIIKNRHGFQENIR